jgi:putative ABC transport system permease protein
MRLGDLWRESIASVASRPARSLLTMTGTVLGCAALIAIVGLTTTASGQITAKFNELEATTVTVVDAELERTGLPGYDFPDRVGPSLEELAGVVSAGVVAEVILPFGYSVGIRPAADLEAATGQVLSVWGTEPGALAAAGTDLVSGHGMDQFHVDQAQPVAVLGFAAAVHLGISTVATAPTVFVGNAAYTVVGILGEGGTLPQLSNAVMVPITTALARFGPPPPSDPARVLIRTELGAAELIAGQAPAKLRPDNPELLAAMAPPDWSMVTDDVNTSVNALLLALAGIALIIGCVAIANTTLVAVMERTGEIGLRQALGAKPVHVLAQFLAESVLLGAIGGLLGSALGVVAVLIGSVAQAWTPVMDPALTLASPAVGTVVGALAGLYPAWRASRIPPAGALQRT